MIDYDYKGVRIKSKIVMENHIYQDAHGRSRSWLERKIVNQVDIHGFDLTGNVTDIFFVRSTLTCFVQSSWRKYGAKDKKINLSKELYSNNSRGCEKILKFVARQKNNQNYLQIALFLDGKIKENSYFDNQEATMVELVFSKVINILQPEVSFQDSQRSYY